MTPSITKTLNKARTNISDNRREDKEQETRKRIKNVIISSKRRVIKSHSESMKKARTNKSQASSIRN
jgi:hypothetical protein